MSDLQNERLAGTTRRDVLRSGLIGGAALAVAASSGLSAFAQTSVPKPGGNLRVAFLGAIPTETLDPHSGVLATNVEGLTQARTGYAMGHFGWKSVWLS